MHIAFKLAQLAIALIIGNFLYQYMRKIPNIQIAIERSFFQCVALFCAYFAVS